MVPPVGHTPQGQIPEWGCQCGWFGVPGAPQTWASVSHSASRHHCSPGGTQPDPTSHTAARWRWVRVPPPRAPHEGLACVTGSEPLRAPGSLALVGPLGSPSTGSPLTPPMKASGLHLPGPGAPATPTLGGPPTHSKGHSESPGRGWQQPRQASQGPGSPAPSRTATPMAWLGNGVQTWICSTRNKTHPHGQPGASKPAVRPSVLSW